MKHNSRNLTWPELKKLTQARWLARVNGEESDLSPEEWLSTLSYFNFRCAYCLSPYAVIEHFIPLGMGVGTVARNCVPACRSCNNLKEGNRDKFKTRATNLSNVIRYLSSKAI